MAAIIEDHGEGGLRGNPEIIPGSPTDGPDQVTPALTAASASTMPAP
jgi:hypothetical protein